MKQESTKSSDSQLSLFDKLTGELEPELATEEDESNTHTRTE